MKILWTIMLTVLLYACNKNEVNAVSPIKINLEGKLLQSYVVNDEWETTYHYNADNTLKEIVFKTDGEEQYKESFTYKNGKIVESLKQSTDGVKKTTKQYEYKGDVIVKKIERLNDGSIYTSYYKYDKNNFLEKITTKESINSYEKSTTTTIEKLPETNKIRVSRTGVATHVITHDDKLMPEALMPGYRPIVRINNNGLTGNILLTEIYPGDECTSTIKADIEFDTDGTTVLQSKKTFKSARMNEVQAFKYNYRLYD